MWGKTEVSAERLFICLNLTSGTAFFHLCNVTKIQQLMSHHDAEKLVHAFVTSRLDYCIFFIFWLPV